MPDPFPDCPTAPRVYNVAAGLRFAKTFAEGLAARLRELPPETAARTRVFVSGSDQAKVLRRIFNEVFCGGFVPAVHSARHVGSDPAIAPPLPPGVSPRHRLMTLARLVGAYLQAEGDPADGGMSVTLAARLGELLDELALEGIDPAALRTALPDELAEHWQTALRFLGLVGDAWPEYLAERGQLDVGVRRALAVDRLLADWRRRPPDGPVLLAGSTATDAVVRRLAVAVAALPMGAVVLPGFDQELDDAAWDAILDPKDPAPGHPQYSMRVLLEALDVSREAAKPWSGSPPRPARTRLLGQALRPAPVTEAWRRDAGRHDAIAAEAMAGVELVEANSVDEEASVIALALREAAEDSQCRAVFVTEDSELRQRVLAKCERWNLRPVDRRGGSIASTPYGRYAIQAARIGLGPPDMALLFGFLKETHCRAGHGRETHERLVVEAELILRRASAQPPGLAGLRAILAETDRNPAEVRQWLAGIESDFAPLAAFRKLQQAPFRDLLHAHLTCIDRIEGNPVASADRKAVRKMLDALWEEGPALGDVAPGDYPDLLAALMVQEPGGLLPAGNHPRLSVDSTLSARFDPPDLILFGGLNEDVAPGRRGESPWINRGMRAALDLPPTERRIGALAHDAAELFACGRVLLSRAARGDGESRLASRWLLRLVNLLEGIGENGRRTLAAMREAGQRRVQRARAMDRPAGVPEPAARPRPKPPVDSRPRRFTATEIEWLIRDPYRIYASKILRLQPLERLGAEPGPALRGNLVHGVMATYLNRRIEEPNDRFNLRQRLQEALADEAAGLAPRSWAAHWPWTLDVWCRGIERKLDWLAEEEQQRLDWLPGAAEVKGSMRLAAPAGAVEIVARADRIDVREVLGEPTCRIYDYKSSQAPTRREIGNFEWRSPEDADGWAWQLGVEALIAAAGGFESLPPARPDHAAYIGLLGPEAGEGTTMSALPETGCPLESIRDGLGRLLAAYDDPDTPYVARALVDRLVVGPYDHLSRFREWATAGDPTETEDG